MRACLEERILPASSLLAEYSPWPYLAQVFQLERIPPSYGYTLSVLLSRQYKVGLHGSNRCHILQPCASFLIHERCRDTPTGVPGPEGTRTGPRVQGTSVTNPCRISNGIASVPPSTGSDSPT